MQLVRRLREASLRELAVSNTKRVVIAGAGGFGRGVYSWLKSSPRHLASHSVSEVVFIDDAEPEVKLDSIYIGTIQGYRPRPDDEVICALGQPKVRQRVTALLQETGAQFHTFVDDRAILGAGVTMGEGVVICPGVVISANATIKNHVHVNFNSSIGHDTTLQDFVTLSPGVNVMGQVVVGQGAFLGGSACVLPRLSVGQGATIGAGSVCVAPVVAGSTVVGNPARVTGEAP